MTRKDDVATEDRPSEQDAAEGGSAVAENETPSAGSGAGAADGPVTEDERALEDGSAAVAEQESAAEGERAPDDDSGAAEDERPAEGDSAAGDDTPAGPTPADGDEQTAAAPGPDPARTPLSQRLVGRCRAFAEEHKGPLLGAVAVLAVVAVGVGVFARFTGLPDGAAFRVGDQVVTEEELDRRVQLLGALYGIQPPADPGQQETFRRDTAKAIAVSTVLDQVADDRGIAVSEKEARDSLVAGVEQQMGSFDREKYTQLLAETGAAEADVLDEISRQRRTAELFQQVAGPAASAVTEADIRAHYDQHPDQMVAPEQRHLRNVVVATEAEAGALAERARGGEDLRAIAEQSTLDQSTRAKRGDLGFVGRAQIEKEFGDAAFGAAPGAVFGPVRSAHGWNVGQVLEVRPETPISYEQVQTSLGDRLRSERGLEAWRTWMDEQVAQAGVTYASAFEPEDPSALTMPGAPVPGTDAPGAEPAAAEGPGAAEIGILSGVGLLGLGFVALGCWGRRNAERLAAPGQTGKPRAGKVRSLRRGGLISVVGGAVIALLAVAGVVGALLV